MSSSAPTKRHLPYLSRNWSQGISAATSGARPRRLQRGHVEGVNGIDTSPEDRPSKRQRLARDVTPEPPRAAPSRIALPSGTPLAPRSLRVNVLKIAHKESEKRIKSNPTLNNIDGPAHQHTHVVITKALCRLTVLDNSPLSKHMPPVLYCMSHPCTIRSFKSPFGSGPMARIHLDQPFHIPENSLKVNREDNSLGLAENYRLDVELFADECEEWPPLELSIPAEYNTQGSKRWVLLACMENLFEKKPTRAAPDLFLHQYTRQTLLDTDFVVDIDARWSTGLQDRHPISEGGTMNSITVANGEGGTLFPQNGHVMTDAMLNGDAHTNGAREMSEEPDGETTPNRALRARVNNTVYNLKMLSDKAHGKGKKSRPGDDGHVSYVLPTGDVSVDSYRCIACSQAHQSIKFLRAHLRGHSEYKFDLRLANGVSQFRVTHNYEWYSPPPDEFQFTKPAKGYNIDQIVKGKGPLREENPVPQRPVQRRQNSSARKRSEKRKVMLPNTKQLMYDPVSRALLEPGTELVPPEADDSWRIQKHRDNIADYVDIPSPEREYIASWDAFVLPKGLSSEVFLPETLVEYTKEKAPWLVASKQRLEEFLKHVSSLQVRAVIEQSTKEEVLGIIGEAMEAMEAREQEPGPGSDVENGDGREEDPGDWTAARRVENCDECGQVATSILCILVCSNASCNKHFHSSCIQGNAKMNPTSDPWLCNHCAPDLEPRFHVGSSPVTA